MTGYRDPISAYVSAPQSATNPPTIHAEKNMAGVAAACAASREVLKIPIPITRPITIMVRSNRFSFGFELMGMKINIPKAQETRYKAQARFKVQGPSKIQDGKKQRCDSSVYLW